MSTNDPDLINPAPAQMSSDEASVRLRLLETQLEDAELRLEKSKRDDERAEEEAKLRLRQLQLQTERAEIELSNLKRESAKSNAEAQEARNYIFSETVSDLTIKAAISDLGKLSRRFPGQPLTIILTSPGGSVRHGFALYDYLRYMSKQGHEITVIVLGMAASMGGILLQAGDKRIIGQESEVLIHEVSAGTAGNITHMQESVDTFARLWNKLAHILARRAKATGKKNTMTVPQIKKKSKNFDWWLDADEAVKLGFADSIL